MACYFVYFGNYYISVNYIFGYPVDCDLYGQSVVRQGNPHCGAGQDEDRSQYPVDTLLHSRTSFLYSIPVFD